MKKKYYIVKTTRAEMDEAKFAMVNQLGKKIIKWSDWAIETEDALYQFSHFDPMTYMLPVSVSDYDGIDLSSIISKLESSAIAFKRISSVVELPAEEVATEPVEEVAPVESTAANDEEYKFSLPPAKSDKTETEFNPEELK